MNKKLKVVSLFIHNISPEDCLARVVDLAVQKTPSFVCFANVHMVVEAYKDESFGTLVNQATMVVSDGAPVAKACKWLYNIDQERIAGMNFLPDILKEAGKESLSVFLYGSTDAVLSKLQCVIAKEYPEVKLSGAISPPFRPLTDEEQTVLIDEINDAAPNIVLVALGCPKQEKWMAQHYQKIQAPLLGLGGAFSVLAGVQKRAPEWMQILALEWLYRLIQEPRRLWKRYFYTNSLFIWLLFKQMIKRSGK
jgi:N-acetylglucosaminyldiphosphoundecaprenol N-acetyl-beta-D-mannosaminyltransferase